MCAWAYALEHIAAGRAASRQCGGTLSLLESELHSGAVDARELGPLFKHVAIVVEILDAQEHVSLLDLPAEVCRAALLLQPYLWCRPWKIRQGGCQLVMRMRSTVRMRSRARQTQAAGRGPSRARAQLT